MNTFTKTYAKLQRIALRSAYSEVGINPALAKNTYKKLLRCLERKDPVSFGSELEHGWNRLEKYND